MGPAVAVAFSLPSVIAGEQDANGLCTVQLLNTLADAHNELLEQMHVSGGQAGDDALMQLSYQTPYEVARRMLISYDPSRNLAPLLVAFRRHDDADADADDADTDAEAHAMGAFDFGRIERELVHRVLAHARPLAVAAHHFQYRGEVQRTGRLSRLRQRMPQRPLPDAVLTAVWEEVDTQQRASQLLALLEQAIGFLSAPLAPSADAGAAAEQPLGGYVQEALLVSAEAWEELRTPSIERHVRLCHLQSLFMALEEGSPSGALERVSLRYREPLTAELEAALDDARLRPATLLPILNDLMLTQLAEGTWPADAQLKMYLSYADADLADAEWYEAAFPYALELRHTCACYVHVRARSAAALP
jgi:hypothetical protein